MASKVDRSSIYQTAVKESAIPVVTHWLQYYEGDCLHGNLHHMRNKRARVPTSSLLISVAKCELELWESTVLASKSIGESKEDFVMAGRSF